MITLSNYLNEASGAKKIPYDLVSSLAILRDYDVIEDSDYVNEEHKLLVDIADSLFNVGMSVANNFKAEYKEVYDKYGKSYFNKVLKDMRALDSQIGSGNVNDLIDEINDKLAAFGGIDESYMIKEQDVEIEVKHDGILEVPEGKNVDDLPMSHFEKLAKKKGLGKITKALNNLQVWNKNDDPKLSKWAGNMIDKLNKKLKKDESFIKESGAKSYWSYNLMDIDDNKYYDKRSIRRINLIPCNNPDDCYTDFGGTTSWAVCDTDYGNEVFCTKDQAYSYLLDTINRNRYEREHDI